MVFHWIHIQLQQTPDHNSKWLRYIILTFLIQWTFDRPALMHMCDVFARQGLAKHP